MKPGIRAARDLEATRLLIRMARALSELLGGDAPTGLQPTRGNVLEKAMFQREALARWLGEVVDAMRAAQVEGVPGLEEVRAWIRERATVAELQTLPGIGRATAERMKAEV